MTGVILKDKEINQEKEINQDMKKQDKDKKRTWEITRIRENHDMEGLVLNPVENSIENQDKEKPRVIKNPGYEKNRMY